MATTPTATRDGNTLRPEYRMFTVQVTGHRRLGPSFVRLTFAGESLRHFGAGGDDQRVNLVLPQPGRTVDDVPFGRNWYATLKAMADEVRPALRTYTVRSHRPEDGEMDIDFALHGIESGRGGPASAWAAVARPGEHVVLVGPDRPGTGRMWGCEWSPPQRARRLLLAGDETAVPAVAAIVESLPERARGIVALEVPTLGDIQSWNVPNGVDVRWSVRQRTEGTAPHGELLETAVAAALDELCEPRAEAGHAELEDVDVDTSPLWEAPGGAGEENPSADELYGWLAGEAGVIKRLRRLMVHDYHMPRTAVAFMGYWREGRS